MNSNYSQGKEEICDMEEEKGFSDEAKKKILQKLWMHLKMKNF